MLFPYLLFVYFVTFVVEAYFSVKPPSVSDSNCS